MLLSGTPDQPWQQPLPCSRQVLLLAAGYTDGDLVLTLCIAWEAGLLRTGSDVWSAVRVSPAQAASGGQQCNSSLTYLLCVIGSDRMPAKPHGAAICGLQLPAVLLVGHGAVRQCPVSIAPMQAASLPHRPSMGPRLSASHLERKTMTWWS